MRKLVFYAGTLLSVLLCLALSWVSAWRFEAVLAGGQQAYVALRPADPRSLMQGDYMRLRYAVERQIPESRQGEDTEQAAARWMVLQLDDQGVGQFARLEASKPTQLLTGQITLEYRPSKGLYPDSFLFQEGQAKQLAQARYAVFRYGDAGRLLLFGLADENKILLNTAK